MFYSINKLILHAMTSLIVTFESMGNFVYTCGDAAQKSQLMFIFFCPSVVGHNVIVQCTMAA
jgi:hypothetical protein